ncbi:MAG TPA: glycosyltransferase family 39 protein [Anaerolineales bacterium]|nr:glycosyltransferase family 39 protein [Anaerolineales bacterium]
MKFTSTTMDIHSHQPIPRKYWLVFALILVVLGQALMREPQPFPYFDTLADTLKNWNDDAYLALSNPFNTLIGLALILLGTIVSALSTRTAPAEDYPVMGTMHWEKWKRYKHWVILNLIVYGFIMVQLALHKDSVTFFWGWLAFLLVFTILFWENEHKPMEWITLTDAAWILGLFTLATAMGAYLLNDLPAGWIADEGPFWVAARNIAIGKTDPSFFDTGVFTFPIASSLLQGWIMRWAGINMWGWRFASVLPAAGSVIPLYLLTRELFDRRTAIAASFMMIANPYFLAFARLGYNNIQALIPVTLCLYFLTLGLKKNSLYYFWLAGLAAGVGFYTYFAAWLGLAAAILIILAFTLISRQSFRSGITSLLVVSTAACLVILPRVLYGASGENEKSLTYKIWETGPINLFYGKLVFGDERMAEADIFNLEGIDLFYDASLYKLVFTRGFIRTTAVLFDPIGYNDHPIVFGLAGPGSSIFFALGFGMALVDLKKLRHLIMLIFFLAGFFFLGVLASIPPRPTHMVAILPAIAMISASGLTNFTTTVLNTIKERRIMLTTAGILSIIVLMGCVQYFFLLPFAYAPPNQNDYIAWLTRQIQEPIHLYIIDNQVEPVQDSLSPHTTTMLSSAEISVNPEQVSTWKNFVAFISPQSGADYAEELAAQIPGADVQAAYAPGQRLRGYVISDLPLKTSMDISLQHGITDLWNSPARSILLICGVGSIFLFAMQWLTGKTSNKMSETL